jgi:hypothetical protein
MTRTIEQRHSAWLAQQIRNAMTAAQQQPPGRDRAMYVLGWLAGQARIENAELHEGLMRKQTGDVR